MKIILQPFGIGDVIFSMGAIKMLNDKILWPVLPEYASDLNRAYPDIHFIDWNLVKVDYNRKDRHFHQDAEVIPLRWQDVPIWECMKNKFAYFGLDWKLWRPGAMWKRDYEKEFALVKRLDIERGEKFNLINIKWGCQSRDGLRPGASYVSFKAVDNGLRNIVLDIIPGYSLFDWSTIIERAANIHTVSTSLLYLIELLRLSAKEIHLYRRPNEKDFKNVDYIFSKNYILHY